MAIETSFPCIPHIKKVQEEGWDTYSKGCLCDGKVLICGGGGAYSREEDNLCKTQNFFLLLYRSGCVVVPLRSFPALELDTYFVDGALMDQIHKVTLCHTTQ